MEKFDLSFTPVDSAMHKYVYGQELTAEEKKLLISDPAAFRGAMVLRSGYIFQKKLVDNLKESGESSNIRYLPIFCKAASSEISDKLRVSVYSADSQTRHFDIEFILRGGKWYVHWLFDAESDFYFDLCAKTGLFENWQGELAITMIGADNQEPISIIKPEFGQTSYRTDYNHTALPGDIRDKIQMQYKENT